MTVSLPVIEYAEYLKADHEKLIRALVLSNLIAIYQKCRIGRLSAYCGAVSAAAGAGAGITYLYGEVKNRSLIQLSILLPMFPELSVMVQVLPVQLRLLPVWMQQSWEALWREKPPCLNQEMEL